MNARWTLGLAALGMLAWSLPTTAARGLGVEVWTDRGDDAVYQPAQTIEIKARASDDAYLLVYEIDAEGSVRLLYPYRGSTGFVEGRRTYRVPPERSNVDLVVQGPVGQCYVVAIASRDGFLDLPWYLRPYDLQGEDVGYEGVRDDEQGVTAEGRIVGDPFVAMERIRRRVLRDPNDPDAFGTSYATYYVHNEVRYPRYLCYDCHRPGRWAWWSGFDPYYATCSVIDLRVNWNWGWGPGYWFGCMPYYQFVPRADCPPRYRPLFQSHARFSSWDGWRSWQGMWGNRLVRYKSEPPAGYIAPGKFRAPGVGADARPRAPGFITRDVRDGRGGRQIVGMTGRGTPAPPRGLTPREQGNAWRRQGSEERRPEPQGPPGREVRGDPEGGGSRRGTDFRDGGGGRSPRTDEPRPPERQRIERPQYPAREGRPRYERPPVERATGRTRGAVREARPGNERPRIERAADRGREPRPADPGRSYDGSAGGRRARG